MVNMNEIDPVGMAGCQTIILYGISKGNDIIVRP